MGEAAATLSSAHADADFELLHVDTLRFLPQPVRQLGGAPRRCCGRSGSIRRFSSAAGEAGICAK